MLQIGSLYHIDTLLVCGTYSCIEYSIRTYIVLLIFWYCGSSDDDEDNQPIDAETEEEGEESEDELVCATQEEREQAILQPNTWILSKDKKIQYSRDDCPPDTRRNSIPTIHKGMFFYGLSLII